MNKVNDFSSSTNRERKDICFLGEFADTNFFFFFFFFLKYNALLIWSRQTDMREIMRTLVVSIDEDLDVSSVFSARFFLFSSSVCVTQIFSLFFLVFVSTWHFFISKRDFDHSFTFCLSRRSRAYIIDGR